MHIDASPRLLRLHSAQPSRGRERRQQMIRCVMCGCSRLDSRGIGCALCGGSPAVRSEQVHVSDETKDKLLANAEELKSFGLMVEEQRTFRKVVGAVEAIGIALAVADSLNSGVLHKLIRYLWRLRIPEEQILRLRLDEPEKISKILGTKKRRKATTHPSPPKSNKARTSKTSKRSRSN